MSAAPPFNPAAFGAAPPPPPKPDTPAVDENAILGMIREKVTFGSEKVQTDDQLQWAFGLLKDRVPDLAQLHGMLQNSASVDVRPLYEEQQKAAAAPAATAPSAPPAPAASAAPVEQPPETQINSAATTPPPNPVSDSTAAQQAAPPPADAPPPPGSEQQQDADKEADPAAWDRISGQQCKSLRGLKSRLSKTHKVDWKDYCARFSLNPETGLEKGEPAAAPPPPAGSEIPSHNPPSSPGLPTQRTPDGNQQASLPPAPEQPQFGATPLDHVPTPKLSYVGSTEANLDYKTAVQQGIPSMVQTAQGNAANYEEVRYVFLAIDNVGENNVDYQIYRWLTEIHQSGGKLGRLPQTYQSPSVQEQPVPAQEVPMFAPPAAQSNPAPAAPAQQPEQQALDLVTAASNGAFGQQVADFTSGLVNQAQPQQYAAPQQQQAPPAQGSLSMRQSLAQTMGGEVDCIFVPLADATSTDLSGRVDANQLAGQAEIEALQQVVDPEDLKFRKDRRVAEQIFARKLTENPRVYVLVVGFNWVLPENLSPILLRRVCTGGMVKNGAYLEFSF